MDDIPRGPDAILARVPPVVLKAQRDEVLTMMDALTRMASTDPSEDSGGDPELRPLLSTIPRETLAVLGVAINQFAIEALMGIEDMDGPPALVAMMQMAQNSADVGHRCGYLRGLAAQYEQSEAEDPEEVEPDAPENPDDDCAPLSAAGGGPVCAT